MSRPIPALSHGFKPCCLDIFQERGYSGLDTARVYIAGKQETFTAAAKWKERGLSIATKCYPMPPVTHSEKSLRAGLDKSLAELQTDCTLRAIDAMYKEGKFKRFGLSNYAPFEVSEIVMTCEANGWVRPTIYQAIYSAIHRGIEAELIPCCRRYGLDVVIFNPLAAGFLSGKHKTADVPATGRFASQAGVQGRMHRDRYFSAQIFAALRAIEPATEKHGLAMVEIALRWCVDHSALRIRGGGRDGVIIGFSGSDQLERNPADLEKGPLPQDVVDALYEAWRLAKGATGNFWHGELVYGYEFKGLAWDVIAQAISAAFRASATLIVASTPSAVYYHIGTSLFAERDTFVSSINSNNSDIFGLCKSYSYMTQSTPRSNDGQPLACLELALQKTSPHRAPSA
ncbi:NADP-dependent oxidoreductase domain-containing protein [Camillea tinctor]|nr:NADP-dependent oxidoreductase domain-containing protein [Camillea tinctor]